MSDEALNPPDQPIEPNPITAEVQVARQRSKKGYRQEKFLVAFKKVGTILHACKEAEISVSIVKKWRRNDEKFAAKFDDANTYITDMLERSALQRAMNGTPKYVVKDGVLLRDANGQPVVVGREWETVLTIFMLKARDKRFQGLDKVEVDFRFVEEVIGKVVNVISRIPECCPNCKTNLNLKGPIADDLQMLSREFEKANPS